MSVTRTALAVALGAGTMYLLDPQHGERRRERFRQRTREALGEALRISSGEGSGERWSPALRLVVATVGVRFVVRAMRRPGPLGFAAGLLGIGALARSVSNQPLAQVMEAAGAVRPPATNSAMGAANARAA